MSPRAASDRAKDGAVPLVVHDVVIESLNAAPYNPRALTEKEAADLKLSIERFGMVEPIVVNEHPGRENVIVGGHQRLNICRMLGHTTIPVVYVNLPEPKERELNLRLNRNTGHWDWDMLAEFDLPLLRDVGFTDEELAKNFDLDGGETPTDADVLPEKVTPRVKVGDVWLLGEHRLVCGDALKPETLALLLGSEQADCVWTDPPYNVAYQTKLPTGDAYSKSRRKDGLTIANDDMTDEQFRAFLVAAFTTALGVTREGGPIYVTHADVNGETFRRAFREAGWSLRQCLVWNKDRLVMGRQDYQWKHEPILYGWKPGASHRWYGGRTLTTVLDVPRPASSDEHPTMKPVDLVRQCVAASTMPEGVVLDPFGGSGSTLIACEVAGRRAALVELEPRYCDVTLARWERMTGSVAALVPRAKPARPSKMPSKNRTPRQPAKAARRARRGRAGASARG